LDGVHGNGNIVMHCGGKSLCRNRDLIGAGLEILKPINSIRIRNGSLRNSGQSVQRVHLCACDYSASGISNVSSQGTIENLRLNSSGNNQEQQCENGECGNCAIGRQFGRLASLKSGKHTSSSISMRA